MAKKVHFRITTLNKKLNIIWRGIQVRTTALEQIGEGFSSRRDAQLSAYLVEIARHAEDSVVSRG
jgi:hypothetical protein